MKCYYRGIVIEIIGRMKMGGDKNIHVNIHSILILLWGKSKENIIKHDSSVKFKVYDGYKIGSKYNCHTESD